MALSDHDDRFDYESGALSSYERASMGEKVAKLEALKERFLLEARAFAEGVKLIDAEFIDRREACTGWKGKTASIAEQIQVFCERVSDDVGDLIDGDEVERYRAIAALGRGDD